MTCANFLIPGFQQFRSHLQSIEDLMPEDFVKTVDQLGDCFTDRQVSDVLNCQSPKAANHSIIEFLAVNFVQDLPKLCTQLEKISTSPEFVMVISDIRKSCKSMYIHLTICYEYQFMWYT